MQLEVLNHEPRSIVFTEEFRERHDRMTMVVRFLRQLKVKVLTTDAYSHTRPQIEIAAESAQQLCAGFPSLIIVKEAENRVRHAVRCHDVEIIWIAEHRMDLRPQLLIRAQG